MIRFMYNGLKTEGGKLHKASYSMGPLFGVGGKLYHDDTITIYGKHYRSFPRIDGLTVENDSDIMSDYFEDDRIRVTADNRHYPAVLAAYEQQEAKRAARWNKRMAKAEEEVV